MDLNRVIGEVAARHGVRLDPDDPALVLVTVTQLMLQQAQEEFLATARRATAEFVEAAGRAQERAGAALADRVRKTGGARRAELSGILAGRDDSSGSWSPVPTKAGRQASYRWVMLSVPIDVLVFLGGMLAGKWLAS